MTAVLIEGAGGLSTGGIIRHMRQAGLTVVCADSSLHSAGLHLADFGHLAGVPSAGQYFETVLDICRIRHVMHAFPAVPSTLLEWSRQAARFSAAGVTVWISPPETISICTDKWLFYEYFKERGIPMPPTSLRGVFPLIKPRRGSGGAGVFLAGQPVDMTERISQEFLKGEEYSADVLCGLDGRIVARCVRKRLRTSAGAAVAGLTAGHPEIEGLVDRICAGLTFRGFVNIQFIETGQGAFCTEANPRPGGGLGLSLAAADGNWFTALLAAADLRTAVPVMCRTGRLVTRYYMEVATGGITEPPQTGPGPKVAVRWPKTFTEMLESPCLSCPDSPCCRFLILQRLKVEDFLSADYARYLLNFPRIRLGLSRDGTWNVLYEQPCRFLDPASALCRIHGTAAQSSICRHYNPYRCWYKPRLTGDGHGRYLLISRARMEFIQSRLRFDDAGRIVDVPGWQELKLACGELALESWPPAEPPPEALDPPEGPPPVGGEEGLAYADLADTCRDCGAYCCQTLVFPFQEPAAMAGLDYLQFVLGFPGTELGIGGGQWSILVHSDCRHLRQRQCAVFGRKERPARCVYYDSLRCGFRSRFSPAPSRDFVRIPLERFPRLLAQFCFDRNRQVVSRPAPAALTEALLAQQESGLADKEDASLQDSRNGRFQEGSCP